MVRATGRLLRGALVVACSAALLAVADGSAQASAVPLSDCSTTTGVVLAVDFSHWGGPLLRSCGTTPTTPYALLNQGGWHTTGTSHDGPGFICRIGYDGYRGGAQLPTAAEDPCVLTPPASAYWSSWYANPGQHTWSYSQLGALGEHPEPGSVDLWVFGATDLSGGHGGPTISPDAVRARNAAPGTPSRSTSPRPTPSTRPASRAATPSRTGPAAGGVSPSPSTTASGVASSSTTPASQNGFGASPTVVAAQPLSTPPPGHSPSSPVPTIVGLVVVTGVAGLAGGAVRRRRSRSS
jgi:hypothetical protein